MSSPASAEGNLSFSQVCEALSISRATGRNWIRLGKLKPNADGVSFGAGYIKSLLAGIRNGGQKVLKQRRNKSNISGNAVYGSYIGRKENIRAVQALVALSDAPLSEPQIRMVLAHYAIGLVLQKRGRADDPDHPLEQFLARSLDLGGYTRLIGDLVAGVRAPSRVLSQIRHLLTQALIYVPNEDALGLLYISLRDMAERKRSGAYYTPYRTVRELVDSLAGLTELRGRSIFDPCCGTGNFLMGLQPVLGCPDLLYGQDVDPISVQLARINIALSYDVDDMGLLYERITCGDTLRSAPAQQFDIILGNPPWGPILLDRDKAALPFEYRTAKGKRAEACALFAERAISLLARQGYMAFVLPEAILTVRTHKRIRGLMLEACSFRLVTYLGNVFDGVQCPSILLCLQSREPGKTAGCRVKTPDGSHILGSGRSFSPELLPFHITDSQQRCIDAMEALPNKAYLAGNAQFALGIVTGDNRNTLSDRPGPGYEAVWRGSAIYKYHIAPEECYLRYTPGRFQQTAPTALYRAPEKLLYRFICETAVFAYDDKQRLSLNSCNLLIPQIPGLSIKYVLAVLNSRAAAFYLKIRFHSVKLLRSQLEQLPIPVPDPRIQSEIVGQVDRILNGDAPIHDIYETIDSRVMGLYGLAGAEVDLIRAAMNGRNNFLPDNFTKNL